MSERLSLLADQMRETAAVIGGNRSANPARPHIVSTAIAARERSLMLRGSLAESDRAIHVAGQLDSAVETLNEWADTQPDRRLDAIRAHSLGAMARFVDANAEELRA